MLLQSSSPEKRKFDLLVSVLVIVSTAMLFSDAYQTDEGALADWLHRFDTAVLLFFLAEYLARLGLVKVDMPRVVEISAWKKMMVRVKARAAWMLTPLAMVDLLSILPLFMPSDDLGFFRILRLLRLLRLYRIFIYHDPLEKLGKAFSNNSLLYWVASSMVGSTILLGAVAFYIAEADSNTGVKGPFDAVWWTVVTLTTVGYGDTVPSTLIGRVVAMVLMLSGVILFAIFTGVMSQTLVGYLLDVRKERIRMSSTVNHVVICGWSRRGAMIAAELRHLLPDEEIIIFADREEPMDLPDGVIFLRGDACKEAELGKIRLGMARSVVVLAPEGDSLPVSDGYTALVVYTVRSFERKLAAQGIKRTVPIHVCAELMDPENFDHLKGAGADEVVHTALVGSNLLAHSSLKPGMAPVVTELLSWWGQGLDVDPVPAEFGVDLPFRQVANQMQERFGFMVVGVMTADDRLSLNPPGDRKVRADDRLVLIRKQEVVDQDGY
jgi:voltage-gated potassium channel